MKNELEEIDYFYQYYQNSEDYSIKFNFFYGDQASASLGYPQFGIEQMNGFHYARFKAYQD